jgi:hypothetical protein
MGPETSNRMIHIYDDWQFGRPRVAQSGRPWVAPWATVDICCFRLANHGRSRFDGRGCWAGQRLTS